jgi:hypothetical protein
VVQDLGTADIDARLEELLIDGILYAFQEQVRDFCPAAPDLKPIMLFDVSILVHVGITCCICSSRFLSLWCLFADLVCCGCR